MPDPTPSPSDPASDPGSPETRAQRHVAAAEQVALRVPGVPAVPDGTPVAIHRAAVIGAGTMGGGIAMAYANAGIPVLLKDVDAAAVERGMATIRKNYETTVAKGKLSRQACDETLARITPTTSYDGFDTVDLVVEAVFEDMPLK